MCKPCFFIEKNGSCRKGGINKKDQEKRVKSGSCLDAAKFVNQPGDSGPKLMTRKRVDGIWTFIEPQK